MAPKLGSFETTDNELMLKSQKNANQSNSSNVSSSSLNITPGGPSKDTTRFRWKLVPKHLEDHEAVFFIELNQQARQNPRLMTNGKKSNIYRPESGSVATRAQTNACLCQKIIVNKKYSLGSEKHDRVALWEILKHERKQSISANFCLSDFN